MKYEYEHQIGESQQDHKDRVLNKTVITGKAGCPEIGVIEGIYGSENTGEMGFNISLWDDGGLRNILCIFCHPIDDLIKDEEIINLWHAKKDGKDYLCIRTQQGRWSQNETFADDKISEEATKMINDHMLSQRLRITKYREKIMELTGEKRTNYGGLDDELFWDMKK